MGIQGHPNSDHSEEPSESEGIVSAQPAFILSLSFGILYIMFGCFYLFAIRNQRELRNISKDFRLIKFICGASNIILVEIHLLENAVHLPCLLDLFFHNSILAMIGLPYMYQAILFMVCISDDREVRTHLKNKGRKALYLTCFLVLANYFVFFTFFFTSSYYSNCLPNEFSEIFNTILHLVFIVLIYWLRRDIPWKFDALNISRELNIFCVTWILCQGLIKIDSIIGVSNLIHRNFHTILRLGMLVALFLISFVIPYHSRKQKRSAIQPEAFMCRTSEVVIVKSEKKDIRKHSLAFNDQSTLMKAMQSAEKYYFLLDHSRKNFYPELILFPKAVFDFLSSLEDGKEENENFDCFKRIVEDFIKPKAPFEINISGNMRKSIEVYLDKIKFQELPLRSKFEVFADVLTETEELFWKNNDKHCLMNKLASLEEQNSFDKTLLKKMKNPFSGKQQRSWRFPQMV